MRQIEFVQRQPTDLGLLIVASYTVLIQNRAGEIAG